MQRTSQHGFTLLEITIVIVIIALIAGGVIIGRDLIHAAEMRATVRQIEMMDTAYTTFRLKYNCIAGDCSNATDLGFYGGFIIELVRHDPPPSHPLNPISSAHAFSLSMPISIVTNGTNGNNSGFLNGQGIATPSYENYISLKILDDAKFLSGFDVTKIRIPITLSNTMGDTVIGQKKGFWMIHYLQPAADTVISAAGHYYLSMSSGFPQFKADTFLPIDASTFDTRMDDGTPLGGRVRASGPGSVNAVNGARYNQSLDSGPTACIMLDSTGKPGYNATGAATERCAVSVAASGI